MTPPVTIERLETDADIARVAEIERASFSSPWTPDMFRWELRNGEVSSIWVARLPAGHLAGFCCVWLILDELHINNVAVAPEYRRQGIARAMLEHIIDVAVSQGAIRATLEVRRSNQGALDLYERLGFRQAGVRTNYYTNPTEDALVLWRTLVDPAGTLMDPAR